MHIRGTRACISGVRGHAYPGYEGMHIRGTRACISGVRGHAYPGYNPWYDVMHIRAYSGRKREEVIVERDHVIGVKCHGRGFSGVLFTFCGAYCKS